jgi:hypothetical protein
MADTLYLSLWYPNLRLDALPEKLLAVLGAFAAHGGDARVYSATVWPLNWSESPVFQRLYGKGEQGAEPAFAVAEALELLHDDFAYEFQIGWSLLEIAPPQGFVDGCPRSLAVGDLGDQEFNRANSEPLATPQVSRMVRVTGLGPLFDDGACETEGQIRVDFGSDAPFLAEDLELDSDAARRVEENVRQLVELTAAIERASGATARLLWSELGESLASRLAARLSAQLGGAN